MRMVLHVMDVDFTLRGEIAHFTSLCITRERAGAGSFSLCMHAREAEAAGAAIGRVIFPVAHPERAGIIERLTREEESGTVTLGGVMLAGLLERRLALPDAADADGTDSLCADAESVMRHYVDVNAVAPADERRRMACLMLEENGHRGPAQVRWRARYEPLGQVLGEIAAHTDTGYDVIPDFAQRRLVFRFRPGRDLTGGAGGVRVTFSLGMGNAQGVTRCADEGGTKSTVYVGGAGEGAARAIGVTGGGAQGLDRREIFADAGSAATAEELAYAGERTMEEYAAVDTLSCQVIDAGALRYGRDWDVGDLVNVQGAGATRQLRVTRVTQELETGRAGALTVVFGEAEKGVTAMVKRLQRAAVR